MRLHFRPFPGLTLFTVIAVIILVGLGKWQYDRLQWKTAYLAEVEAAVTAPPLTSLAAVEAALEVGTPVDFSRVQLTGEIIEGQTPFLVYSRQKTTLSWRPFVPVLSSDRAVFVGLKPIPDSEREAVPTTQAKTVSLAGYVRLWRPSDRGVPDSTPLKNRWFGFNPMPDSANWGDSVPGGADMRYYIDVVSGASDAASLPLKRPNIRNNHFDYMLTWWGLAIVLLVIYGILHVQRGRLGRRPVPDNQL